MENLQELLNIANKKLAIATKNMHILKDARAKINQAKVLMKEARDDRDDAIDAFYAMKESRDEMREYKEKYETLSMHWNAAVEAAGPPDTQGQSLYMHILELKRKAKA